MAKFDNKFEKGLKIFWVFHRNKSLEHMVKLGNVDKVEKVEKFWKVDKRLALLLKPGITVLESEWVTKWT